MPRSTKADKARQLNAAQRLLKRNVPLREGAQRLSREFGLSLRQAYRYLEEAAQFDEPVAITEATIPLRSNCHRPRCRAARVCDKQWPEHRGDCGACAGRLSGCSTKAWVSAVQGAARGFILPGV